MHDKTKSTAGRSQIRCAQHEVARFLMTSARSFGSEAHFPRQLRLPSSRIETAVSFRETSSPIYCSMVALHSMLRPGANREPVFPSYRGATTLPACPSGPWPGGESRRDHPMFWDQRQVRRNGNIWSE